MRRWGQWLTQSRLQYSLHSYDYSCNVLGLCWGARIEQIRPWHIERWGDTRVTYKYQSPQRGVVRIWKVVDKCMQWIPPLDVIIDPYRNTCQLLSSCHMAPRVRINVLTSCINEIRIVSGSKQGIRQFSKELFQQPGDTINIVIEVLGIRKVHLWRVCHP